MPQQALTPSRLPPQRGHHFNASAARRSSRGSGSSPMPFHSPAPTPITNRVVLEISSITLSHAAFKQTSPGMFLSCSLKILQHSADFQSSPLECDPRSSVLTFKLSSPWNRIEQILHRANSSSIVHLVVKAQHCNGELVGEAMSAVAFSTAPDFQGAGILNIMLEGNKVGEAKYTTFHPVEGFLDDSASEDGDQASATPSPLPPSASAVRRLTPGRMLDSRINLTFPPEVSHEPSQIEDEEEDGEDDEKENMVNVELSPRITRSGLSFDNHSASKRPRSHKSPRNREPEMEQYSPNAGSTDSERQGPTSSINAFLLRLVVVQMLALVILVFLYLSQPTFNSVSTSPTQVITQIDELAILSGSMLEELVNTAASETALIEASATTTADSAMVALPYKDNLKIKLTNSTPLMVQLFISPSVEEEVGGCVQWKVSMTGGMLLVGDCSVADSWWQVLPRPEEKTSFGIAHLKSQKCLDYSAFPANHAASTGKIGLQHCGKDTTRWSYRQFNLLSSSEIDSDVQFGVAVDRKGRRKLQLIRVAKLTEDRFEPVEVKLRMNVIAGLPASDYFDVQPIAIADLAL